MRSAGIVLIIVGAILMFINGFDWIEREKVADFGNVEISKDRKHEIYWSPVIGVILLATGVIALVAEKR